MTSLDDQESENFSLQTLLKLKESIQKVAARQPSSRAKTNSSIEPIKLGPTNPQSVIKYALQGFSDKEVRKNGGAAKACLDVTQAALKSLYESHPSTSESDGTLQYATEKLHSSLILRLIENGMVCLLCQSFSPFYINKIKEALAQLWALHINLFKPRTKEKNYGDILLTLPPHRASSTLANLVTTNHVLLLKCTQKSSEVLKPVSSKV